MRTTITIPDDLYEDAVKLSGKTNRSEVIVSSLTEYVSLKKRLELLDLLFDNAIPHSLKKLKKDRKKNRWS